MRVLEVNSIDALPGLRLVWKSLLGETPHASFHQSCEWFEAVCRHLPPATQPRVLVVAGGGETIGILPLVQQRQPTASVVTYLRDPWSPQQGPIGPQPTATLMTALRYLADRRDWEVLELGGVNLGGRDHERTRTALQVAALRYHEIDTHSFPIVDFATARHDRSTGAPSAPGKSMRSARERLVSEDVLTFERYRPRGTMYGEGEPRRDVFEQCLSIATAGPVPTARRDALLHDIHTVACRGGAADLNLLRQGNQLVACCYNVHFDGTLLTLFAGEEGGRMPRDDQSTQRTAAHRQVGTLLPVLVERMVQDSVDRHDDLRWIPGTTRGSAVWPPGSTWSTTTARRVTLVHQRQAGSRRLVRHVQRALARLTMLGRL